MVGLLLSLENPPQSHWLEAPVATPIVSVAWDANVLRPAVKLGRSSAVGVKASGVKLSLPVPEAGLTVPILILDRSDPPRARYWMRRELNHVCPELVACSLTVNPSAFIEWNSSPRQVVDVAADWIRQQSVRWIPPVSLLLVLSWWKLPQVYCSEAENIPKLTKAALAAPMPGVSSADPRPHIQRNTSLGWNERPVTETVVPVTALLGPLNPPTAATRLLAGAPPAAANRYGLTRTGIR